jgi:hypothetical protein
MTTGRALLPIALIMAVLAAPAAGWVKGKKTEGCFGLTAQLRDSFRGAVYDMLPGPAGQPARSPADGAGFRAGAQPAVFVVAYPDRQGTATPKIHVQFLRDGKALASQTADLPSANASGAIPMTVGAFAEPGNRELKVAMLKGGESVERSVRYSIASR